jgi:hypothetical protein
MDYWVRPPCFDKYQKVCHNMTIIKEVSRMKSTARILSLLMTGIFLITACTPAATTTPAPASTVDVNPIYTAAAQTIEVESTRKAALIPTSTETPIPTEAPTATATATQEVLATSASENLGPTPTLWIPVSGDSNPTIQATYDTNCRQGPDPSFDLVGSLRVGDTSEVYGMVPNGSWWYIKNPGKDSPKYCWVWGGSTTVSGSTAAVPEIAFPPTPYHSLPTVSLGMSADPATSTTCPVLVTFTATIKTSAEGNFSYVIFDDEGNTLKSGTMVFKDDGSDSISFTKTYKSSYTGWVQMKVTNPVTKKSGHATINFNCD